MSAQVIDISSMRKHDTDAQKQKLRLNFLGLRTISEKYKRAMNLHKDMVITEEMLEEEYQKVKRLGYISGGTIGLLVICGGAIASNGLTLSILTAAGFGMLLEKTPAWVSHIAVEFDLACDVIFSLSVVAMMGASVTGLVSGMTTGIIMSFILAWNRYRIMKGLSNEEQI